MNSNRGIGLRPASRVPRLAAEASPTHQRKMISNRPLAQNDKRKSEDDGRRDHGSELGKYRPESARSELQRFAPCSPTKIVHVGLHVWRRPAGQPAAAAPKGGELMQGN